MTLVTGSAGSFSGRAYCWEGEEPKEESSGLASWERARSLEGERKKAPAQLAGSERARFKKERATQAVGWVCSLQKRRELLRQLDARACFKKGESYSGSWMRALASKKERATQAEPGGRRLCLSAVISLNFQISRPF